MSYHDGSGTKVKDEKIETHTVTFYVTDDGTWKATAAVLDHAVLGKSLLECRTKVRGQLRRATVKLGIKAHLVNVLPEAELEKSWHSRDDKARANNIRPITLIGLSARSRGDVMYTFDDSGGKGKKTPHQSHTDPDAIGVVCRRLTPDEQKGYRALRDGFDNSRDALEKWIKDHAIPNVTTFMEEKISEAVDALPTDDDPEDDADPRTGKNPLDVPLRDQRLDKPKKAGRRGR